MTIRVLDDVKTYIDKYDISRRINKASLELSAAELDKTAFGAGGWSETAAGLEKQTFSESGWVEVGDGSVDEALFAQLGATRKPFTRCMVDGSAGDVAYFFQAVRGGYSPGAQVGEILGFETNAVGDSRVVRGTVVLPKTEISANGNSAALHLGAVAADEAVYAVLHVFDVTGGPDSVTVKVQSDNGAGFATPANQIVFSAFDEPTSSLLSAPGAITDDYWRINYAIVGGVAPSFTAFVAVGIRKVL